MLKIELVENIEEFKVGDHMDTIDKRMNALSMESRCLF